MLKTFQTPKCDNEPNRLLQSIGYFIASFLCLIKESMTLACRNQWHVVLYYLGNGYVTLANR